jgi:hypothetical protein
LGGRLESLLARLMFLKLRGWTMSGPSRFREGPGVGGMHQIFGCLRRFGWTGESLLVGLIILKLRGWGWVYAPDFWLSM